MEKKSLVRTLKTATKKPTIIGAPAKNEGVTTRKTGLPKTGL